MNDPLIGRQVAGYRVERVLGRGGMASVYFAWDTNHNRPVALKVMDERYRDTPSYVERFIREAQSIAAWDQPNIVKVYDAGHEDGIYYYTMEFIRGLDLAQLLRQYLDASQLMPYSEVVRIGWAVAEALDYAHARGILHRDVKPSNVLISVDGRVLLSDFGLVMDVNVGTLGEIFGSPTYIAPEQARSSARAVPQSDNYSLGVMLYEMLTGSAPFYDSSPTALALKHLTEDPPRPRAINPRLNPAVEAVLLRALRKLPAERYATGREMMAALERALSSELRGPEAGAPLPTGTATVPVSTAAPVTRAAEPAPDEPHTEVLPISRSASPAATQVRGYAQPQPTPPASYPPVYAAYPPGPVDNGAPETTFGSVPPYAPAPPRRRSFWGCLGALLAVALLAVLAGAVFSALRPNLELPEALRGLIFPSASATSPAPTLTLTATARPTLTATPLPPTPTLTATATITPTAQASTTLAPQPTASLTPTATDTPTSTPTPVYTLVVAFDSKQAGFVLKNTSKIPMPMTPLEIYDITNHLLVPADAWDLETLQPGECVGMWSTTATPGLPPGFKCSIVGKLLAVAPDEIFWTAPMEIHYNGQKVAVCPTGQKQCVFDTTPK